jgi:hypothetical protein
MHRYQQAAEPRQHTGQLILRICPTRDILISARLPRGMQVVRRTDLRCGALAQAGHHRHSSHASRGGAALRTGCGWSGPTATILSPSTITVWSRRTPSRSMGTTSAPTKAVPRGSSTSATCSIPSLTLPLVLANSLPSTSSSVAVPPGRIQGRSSESHDLATTNIQHLSSDPTRLIRGEENHRVRDILRRPDASKGNPR